MIVQSIILGFIILCVSLYVIFFNNKSGNNSSNNPGKKFVKKQVQTPTPPVQVHQQQCYRPSPPYYPTGFGPQGYGASYEYLPDSLYGGGAPLRPYFEFLNFAPYTERMVEVDNLVRDERWNSLRDY